MRGVTKTQKKKVVNGSTGIKSAVPSKTFSTSKKVSSPYFKKIKRYTKQSLKSVLVSPLFHSTFRIMVAVIVSSGMLYVSYRYIGKTFANEVIVSQSEIIARIGKLTTLPEEAPYEIVRVQDEESLRKQNDFYKDIKEGDYIVMYKDTAVIYDLRENAIVGIRKK